MSASLVAAELADEQRAALVMRPGRGRGEVIAGRAPVGVLAPRRVMTCSGSFTGTDWMAASSSVS